MVTPFSFKMLPSLVHVCVCAPACVYEHIEVLMWGYFTSHSAPQLWKTCIYVDVYVCIRMHIKAERSLDAQWNTCITRCFISYSYILIFLLPGFIFVDRPASLFFSFSVLIIGFTFLPLVMLSQYNKEIFLRLDNKENKNGERYFESQRLLICVWTE